MLKSKSRPIAHGLRVFRENEWIDEVGSGQTTISVVVKQPQVEHKVRLRDFEQWLESQGRTPAEMSLKTRLRELIGPELHHRLRREDTDVD